MRSNVRKTVSLRGVPSRTMASLADFLATRFPNNDVAPGHFGELLTDYASSGLAPPHLLQEVTSDDDGKLWAHVWEAMLYRHLSALGFEFRKDRRRKSGQLGPDFGIVHDGKTTWIEAVTPSPEGIPQDYLEPPRRGECKARTKPHEAMLLRWTAVLKDKRDKLEHYAQMNIIASTDCAVVAVNSCRLSDWATDDVGISQLPFAVEAVFPIGPLAVPVTRDGRVDGEPANVPRYAIRKASGADVSTANFLDARYANVSAIIGCNRRHMLSGPLPLTVVHNPLARVSLETGIVGATKEYVAIDKGDSYLVRELSANEPV
jgi:hypothetical protein